MGTKREHLKGLLTDAIVELCRQESFYVEELKIEGLLCITADRTSVLVTQITEQIGEKPNSENEDYPIVTEYEHVSKDGGAYVNNGQGSAASAGSSNSKSGDGEWNGPLSRSYSQDSSKSDHEQTGGDGNLGTSSGGQKGFDGNDVKMGFRSNTYTYQGTIRQLEKEGGKYKCPFCSKSYMFKHSLKDHINNHTGKKPHVCKHCGMSFTHFGSLCSHIKRHHYSQIPREHECRLCGERFFNLQSLKQHYTWRHKDEGGFPGTFLLDVQASEHALRQQQQQLQIQSLKEHFQRNLSNTDIAEKTSTQKEPEKQNQDVKDDSNEQASETDTDVKMEVDAEESAESSPSIEENTEKEVIAEPRRDESQGDPGPQNESPAASSNKDDPSEQENNDSFETDMTAAEREAMLRQQQSLERLQAMVQDSNQGYAPVFPAGMHQFAYGMGLQHAPVPLQPWPSVPTSASPQRYAPVEIQLPSDGPPGETEALEIRRTQDGKFQCPYCQKSYSFKHTLKDHLNKHLDKRPHVCKHCGQGFTHLASLCAHIKRKHDKEMPQDYQCTICHEKFMNLQSLKQHFTWRHRGLRPQLPSLLDGPAPSLSMAEQSSQPAHVPAAESSDSSTRTSAANTTSSPTFAQEYESLMSNLAALAGMTQEQAQDMISQHSQATTSQATSPTSTNQPTTSIKQEPADTSTPLNSDVTGDQYTGEDVANLDPSFVPGSTPSLNVYNFFTVLEVQDDSDFRYQCKICKNMYKNRTSLYDHLNTHLGKRPHVCSYCGDSFTHHSSLHNHVRNRHASKEEKDAMYKIQCDTCHSRYKFPSELKRHYLSNPDHDPGYDPTLNNPVCSPESTP